MFLLQEMIAGISFEIVDLLVIVKLNKLLIFHPVHELAERFTVVGTLITKLRITTYTVFEKNIDFLNVKNE